MISPTATPRFERADSVPSGLALLAVPVFSDLGVPDGVGAELNREFLAQRRFEGKPGQALAMLADDGTTVLALGVGERGRSTPRRSAGPGRRWPATPATPPVSPQRCRRLHPIQAWLPR